MYTQPGKPTDKHEKTLDVLNELGRDIGALMLEHKSRVATKKKQPQKPGAPGVPEKTAPAAEGEVP